MIVAQGSEAGGHGARRATLLLVPAVVDMVAASGRDVPVVAAGGIADGRGLAASLMLGASGVLMGTRFQATKESLLAPGPKRRIVAASGDDTQRSKIFDIAMGNRWPWEYTGRALVNRFTETWRGREADLMKEATVVADYPRAHAAGEYETVAIYASEAIDLIHEVESAGAIVERVVVEAEAALSQRFV